MTHATTLRAVFDRLIQGITDGRWRDLADVYAEDAVVETPLHAPEPRRVEGRDNVQLQRIRDGQNVATQDYHGPLRLAAVSGGAEELTATVTATTSTA